MHSVYVDESTVHVHEHVVSYVKDVIEAGVSSRTERRSFAYHRTVREFLAALLRAATEK